MASNKSKVTKFFEKFLTASLEEHFRHWAYDGFETYEDYVKYGEMFIYADRNVRKDMRLNAPVEYTPYTRQLTKGTIKP